MGRKSLAALAVSAVMMLAACSGGDGENAGGGEAEGGGGDTWAGTSESYRSGEDFDIGLWSGDHGQTTIECSGDRQSPTMVISSPEGDVATVTPEGSDLTISVALSDGTTVEDTASGMTTGGAVVDFDGTQVYRPTTEDEQSYWGDRRTALHGKWTCQG